MRIMLLTQHFPPEPGPQSRRWGMLVAHFAKRGHRIDVVVPRWQETTEWVPPEGVTVHTVRSFVRGIRLQRRIMNEALTTLGSLATGWRIAHEGPRTDVVIGTVPALGALPIALAIGRGHNIPVVADIRDAWPDIIRHWREWGDTGTSDEGGQKSLSVGIIMSTLVPIIDRVYTSMERSADHVVTTTESLAHVFQNRGIKVDAIRNTSFGLVPAPLDPPAERRDGTLRVLYLGNIGRAQHLATAIRAAAIAQQRGVPVRLRLVGDGAESTAMRQFNERLGHPAEVISRVEAAEVAASYEWADTVLVCLRRWPGMQWTVPSKLYEILQCGRHVSASLRGEAAAIVAEARAGDVVPPEDPEALAELWAELHADRRRLQKRGRGPEWVAEHASPHELAENYLSLLTRVVQRRRESRD
ncbi:glycosyltransferase family 4 protein [Propioniferax innocua]|uniref:Glycosyltransferase involved in cell wall biosynthesis n=1 Tax=Propioniferax innocua TaxID=1753 RepID=A0A542ZCP9_9ACTN|nr:glycosyltransferase family 4 protein [Propioniferax innocua]TQL58114.1 glycosyltransferase involved in cell wall biosynthesis [Propioniferax innocua]